MAGGFRVFKRLPVPVAALAGKLTARLVLAAKSAADGQQFRNSS
eukprot:gene12257-biopygen4501